MKKLSKTAIICLVVVLATLLSAGAVKALQILGADVARVGELEAGTLTVGEQGVGGVTFFNGTIINDTTNTITGLANPVTFGDDVRIDGRVWRGETAGAGDGKAFIVNDDVEIAGSLKIAGQTVTLADYTSRFNTVDSSLSNLTTGLQTVNDNLFVIEDDVDFIYDNIEIVNENVLMGTDWTRAVANNQTDILNTIALNSYSGCLTSAALLGFDFEEIKKICISPPFLENIEAATSYNTLNSDNNIDYQEKINQIKGLLEK